MAKNYAERDFVVEVINYKAYSASDTKISGLFSNWGKTL
jgi:hypothetical protein